MELAHQYGLMDPASNVVKRNVLAEHLREVIDALEQRVGYFRTALLPLLILLSIRRRVTKSLRCMIC